MQAQIRSKIKMFTIQMRKLFGKNRKLCRTESMKLLIENTNHVSPAGRHPSEDVYDNPLAQNVLMEEHCQGGPEITFQVLAQLLCVANTCKDGGPCCSVSPGTNSVVQNATAVHLIQRSVSQHFPKPPADVNQNLQQHLLNVQKTVLKELKRLGPRLESSGLAGCLIECYHHHTFDHLSGLLQNTSSSQNCLVLMKWVLQTYLSQELLSHPSFHQTDPIKSVDLLLFVEWVEKAKNKLLELVQKMIQTSLENILQIESSQKDCDHEEDCIRLYVDIIQCISAVPKETGKISPKLSADIQEVCFQELLKFLERYTSEQMNILKKKAEMDKPETIPFFKTLKTCKELKEHVRTETNITRSLSKQLVEILENMEAFTLKLLEKIVVGCAERHLKTYFTADNQKFVLFLCEMRVYFPKLRWCEDTYKTVMDHVYEHVAHVYLKRLIQISHRKLTRCWKCDVGCRVAKDAVLLHNIMSDLAPGVQQWNYMMLTHAELLECQSTDMMILTVGKMQQESLIKSEDLDLLPALLRWKGLSRSKVRQVLGPPPEQQRRTRSASFYSCFTCCCSPN